jgi:uncharacterized membrane protein
MTIPLISIVLFVLFCWAMAVAKQSVDDERSRRAKAIARLQERDWEWELEEQSTDTRNREGPRNAA